MWRWYAYREVDLNDTCICFLCFSFEQIKKKIKQIQFIKYKVAISFCLLLSFAIRIFLKKNPLFSIIWWGKNRTPNRLAEWYANCERMLFKINKKLRRKKAHTVLGREYQLVCVIYISYFFFLASHCSCRCTVSNKIRRKTKSLTDSVTLRSKCVY